ncbi:hypothetical protein BBJ28_00012649 [Nothophytophthora sp. Chile5]|nr:hypothetical protein BBJ28_00012649 [Nothophytophthora sp. Chile5]
MRLLACLAFLPATVQATASFASECDTPSLIAKLIPLASDPNLGPCFKDTGYGLSPKNLKLATRDQSAKMCTHPECKVLITKVEALNLPSCSVRIGERTFDPANVLASALFACFMTIAATALATIVNADAKTALLAKLLPFATDSNLAPCLKDSGYSLSFSSLLNPKLPTLAQGVRMCASSACQALLGKIVATEMPDSEIKFGDIRFNPADMFNLAAVHCQ